MHCRTWGFQHATFSACETPYNIVKLVISFGMVNAVKVFNTTGLCVPEKHYMVDLTERLVQIKAMVDAGKYFTINRARQYGKTTTLAALRRSLSPEYDVLSLDFQGIGNAGFATEENFVQEFCRLIRKEKRGGFFVPEEIGRQLDDYYNRKEHRARLGYLFDTILEWCAINGKGIVLMIDEVDSATNNQVFVDFLAQLRESYLLREERGTPAFQSVILAGVTDIRNLRRKLRPEEAHRVNSPWNIAADFNIDMSLSEPGIRGMLDEYEADHGTGMDTAAVAREIHAFTNGYPFLVSRICQLMDERMLGGRFETLSEVWTPAGVSEAVRMILMDSNLLFDSIMGKVQGNDGLQRLLYEILFSGERISFNPYDTAVSDAVMYGFIVNDDGGIKISNRIFETLLYNYFLNNEETKNSPIFRAGGNNRADFIRGGRLDLEALLERYVTVFDDLYQNRAERFDEAEGRRRFLLFVRPVINGTGNYYIEAETRNNRRMDLVIDYLGERFVVELKIWDGKAYHEEGEKQLAAYLDALHLNKGYMLTYNFNKTKQQGMNRRIVNGKELIEAIV